MDKTRHKQIMFLYKKGRRLSDIANEIGVSISTVQRTIRNSLAHAEHVKKTPPPVEKLPPPEPVKRAKIVIRSSRNNKDRYFLLTEKSNKITEVDVPASARNISTINVNESQSTKEKERMMIGTAVINEKGVRVGTYLKRKPGNSHNFQKLTGANSSLERGLKIFAATVAPDVQKVILGETVNPSTSSAAPNISIKRSNGLMIKPVLKNAKQTNLNISSPQIPSVTNSGPMRVPISVNPHLNGGNTNSGLILEAGQNVAASGHQNNNLIYSLAPPNVFYQLPNGTLSQVVVKPQSPPTVPKITAVHSQFSPESLNNNKIIKSDLIFKDIEDNPSLYLGIGKKELCILSLLSNGFQLSQKHMFLMLRKLRHNEPVDILGDLFELSGDEVVQIIIDNVPRIAAIFRKGIEVASKNRPSTCVVDQLKLSVRKPSYLSEQPEEICRHSTKIDLKYLISCTHSGLINFVSQGNEKRTKYSNIGNLCKYIKSVNPTTVCLVRNGLSKIDEKYLHYKNVKVQKSVAFCYRVNAIRAIDAIKQFKLLSNSEIPLRQEFLNIIDDFVVIACSLYNCRSL